MLNGDNGYNSWTPLGALGYLLSSLEGKYIGARLMGWLYRYFYLFNAYHLHGVNFIIYVFYDFLIFVVFFVCFFLLYPNRRKQSPFCDFLFLQNMAVDLYLCGCINCDL